MANSLDTSGLKLGTRLYTSDMFSGSYTLVNINATDRATISGSLGKIFAVAINREATITATSGTWVGITTKSHLSGALPVPVSGTSFNSSSVGIGSASGGGIFIRVS